MNFISRFRISRFRIIWLGCFIHILILSSCFLGSKSNQDKKQSDPLNFSYQEKLVDGQRQYHLRGCIKCHGRTGEGNGYRVAFMEKDQVPRNFKDLSSYRQGYDLDSIVFTIQNGMIKNSEDSQPKNKKYTMPAYPNLTLQEIHHIANYVIYLQTNE